MTRLIPTVSSNKDEDKPFEKRNFQRGLRWAGYLEPLDTSRKKIKQRLVLGLEKEDFTAHLDAFLEQKGIKKRGEWMVRFVGATDPHSPFVHLFTTSRLTNPAPVKVYPGDLGTTSSQGPDAFTQGTNLPSSAPGESEWACKAKHFWPPPVRPRGPTRDGPRPAGLCCPRRARGARRRRQAPQPQPATAPSRTRSTSTSSSRGARRSRPTRRRTRAGRARASRSARRRPARACCRGVAAPGRRATASRRRRSFESVRQLGQTRLGQLRGWFQPSSARVELYDYDEEEEHARKERRRARRREEEEARELERRVEQDFDAEKEDRRARKEERRRRRAERELAGQ